MVRLVVPACGYGFPSFTMFQFLYGAIGGANGAVLMSYTAKFQFLYGAIGGRLKNRSDDVKIGFLDGKIKQKVVDGQ